MNEAAKRVGIGMTVKQKRARAEPERLRTMAKQLWPPENTECPRCDLSVGHICEMCGAANQLVLAARTIEDDAAKIKRLQTMVNMLPVKMLLKYPGPFSVRYFVDTLEVVDANGSTLKRPGYMVEECLNLCREAAEAVKEKTE